MFDENHLNKRIGELESIVDAKNKEILARLDDEEKLLREYEAALFEFNLLEAKLINIQKKYNLLSNSKLGKLTLRYWKLRRRIPEDF